MKSEEKISDNLKNEKSSKPNFFLTLLLVIMSSYPPLSTDMYLPALQKIAQLYNTSESIMNLTLVLFFIFFAISTLVWGPISDKFGRKPALLVGIILFTLSSTGCTLSQSVYQLILFRVIQAIAAGAPVTVSIAIVQDLYTGEQKKKILSILSALMMVAPVAAPILGTTILSFSNWRIIFVFLSVLGLISFIGSFFIPETNQYKVDKPILKSFAGLFVVMQNSFFRKTVTIFSLPALVVLGFVGGSSAILMSDFGVSDTIFTICFSVNAFFAIIGSLLYVPLSKRYNTNRLLYTSFFIVLVSGIFILIFGAESPLFFIGFIIPATISLALIRPLSMNLMMEKSGNDAGSASSMINFLFTLIGSIGMEIIALNWGNRTLIFAFLTIITGAFCLLGWHFLINNRRLQKSP